MIDIIVNGEAKSINDSINIKEMLQELSYTKEGFAIALNEIFVAISTYENTYLKAGDKVEILSPVQGG
ncbi:MAG: sulfur carrier protein ThiS [Sulfurovum sp.]